MARVTIALFAALALLALCGEGLAAKPPNIVLVLSDQEQYRLLPASGYELPARARIAQRGVTFRNHYVAAAMCSPSRAALLTGLPPQRNGVFDQMEYPYVPSLSPDLPNMGSVLKKLGYQTAYFGKFEMNRDVLRTKATVNYSSALEPYGFDTFGTGGDVDSRPDSGYKHDALTAGEVVTWLRTWDVAPSKAKKPFFVVASFLNPHDIMYANANLPGEDVQQGAAHHELTSPPANTLYAAAWPFTLPGSLIERLDAPGMPAALAEYQAGWSGALGFIPTDRADMWRRFYDYYLNMIRDNDAKLGELVAALDEMDLWRDTIVIVTADHGEMGGSHGGLRGKGPFAYEENAHVPFVIVHPDLPAGASDLLTSHLDVLPTMVGFTGLPEPQRKAATAGLPGHDFSAALAARGAGDANAVRAGVLFNYVAPLTIDAGFCERAIAGGSGIAGKEATDLATLKPHLDKRGFLAFAFDGRYKLGRYYAPAGFNTPQTLEELFASNDVQLFDLRDDPGETRNLALDRATNGEVLLRMNGLLNALMAREVGVNDGSFLPEVIRP
jgi:arylsulfatase